MKVVECEICEKKMGKKPKYTAEKRDGQICDSCWNEVKTEDSCEILDQEGKNWEVSKNG